MDQISSWKAVEYWLRKNEPRLTPREIKAMTDRGVAIGIPADVHRQHSETVQDKNTGLKQRTDGCDLKKAVDSNFSALTSTLSTGGHSAEALADAFEALHDANIEKGLCE